MSVFSLAACTKDMVDDYGGVIPEGECSVTADVEFKPLAAGLNGATRSAGNAIKEIENLHVLLYDESQKLVESHSITDFTTNADEDRTDADADNGHTAESKTPRAAFNLKIPYGRYYIYAVANMGDLTKEYDVATVDKLKSVSLKWQTDAALKNNQMFGCFIVGDAKDKEPEAAPLITVAQKSMSLHAWIRRAASKVTVAFDASGLKDNIYIYLKSVQIKDIPSHCWLGKDNKPASDAELIREGETIEYAKGNTTWDDNYPARLTNGNPVYGAAKLSADAEGRSVDEQLAVHHGENVEALYFYENMQGQGISKKQDWKEQGKVTFPDGSNKDDAGNLNSPNRKDQMLYGTYIEVKAHYVSRNAGDMSEGDITYRFMLGKDTDKDYDAQRNYHYKLTMKFKGYANDVDWHIDYEREKGIIIPNPYYISYLYNHSMMLPVQVNTEPGVTVTGLSAKIIENRWAPNLPAGDTFDYYKAADIKEDVWNGFLSLHETTETVIKAESPYTHTSNKEYYEKAPKRGERTYAADAVFNYDNKDYSFTTAGAKDSDKYNVRAEGSAGTGYIYHFSLPMYTRAKQLIKETAHTGNNPYVAYQRKAVVRITATLSKGDPYVEDVTIYQVRRIVNPKGVWRKADTQNKTFHVVLKRLPKESATKFESFNSEGPWRAYVIREFPEKNGPVTLSVSDPSISSTGKADIEFNGKTMKDVDIISGRTDTPIDFNIDFKGSIGENESRYAVVRVEYHNNTCYHLIFVRQGDSPDDLVEGGTVWHAMNMKDATTEASSPIDEGSLFKFGNLNQEIEATKNKNKGKSPWVNVKPANFKSGQHYGWTDWDNISNSASTGSFPDPTVGGKSIRVASYDDFKELYITPQIEQGYGVLYGDAATEVLDDIDEVYGYDYTQPGTYGMRGCFVYNRDTGKNLFFPIGASGYGHRKDWTRDETNSPYKGLLRYMCHKRWGNFDAYGGSYPEGTKGAPLFYDLYMRPGAIYWLKQNQSVNDIAVNKGDKEGGAIGWDFNYFTFDFFTISKSNLYGPDEGNSGADRSARSDACFVRCVEK